VYSLPRIVPVTIFPYGAGMRKVSSIRLGRFSASTIQNRWASKRPLCSLAETESSRTVAHSRKTLLWIDDYEPALLVYQAFFERIGFRVLTATRPGAGLHLARTHNVDLVISDYEMPEMNGDELVAILKARNPHLPVIVFSGTNMISTRVKRLADACCDKADPIERLVLAVKRLVSPDLASSSHLPRLRPSSEQTQRTVA